MVTEDYVSFEIAKLLKEKGFDEKCWNAYTGNNWTYTPPFKNSEFNLNPEKRFFTIPTLQMVMKWLREVYNIHIEVKYFFEPHIYMYTIIYTPVALDNISSHPQGFNTYEEACESAIKYCLKNLI